jgi:hypothetical protein
MPAAVTAIYLLLWLLPIVLESKFNVGPKPFRFAVWLVLMIGFGILLRDSNSWYEAKTLAVGRDGDRIYAFAPQFDPTGGGVKQALAWIKKNVPRDGTLAVLPEGAMLNYLSRRVNPTSCLDWTPNVPIFYGEIAMTAACEKNPPDYICLVERNTSEYGVSPFGRSADYGGALMQWIEKSYVPVCLIGHEPFRNGLFGIEFLKRLPTNKPAGAKNFVLQNSVSAR